jgi:hypothetical protein
MLINLPVTISDGTKKNTEELGRFSAANQNARRIETHSSVLVPYNNCNLYQPVSVVWRTSFS